MKGVAVATVAEVAARDLVWPADGTCEYHTEQPAPAQWIAVGLGNRPDPSGGWWRRLVVGTGTTEATAVEDMRQRCRLRSAGYQWHAADGAEA